MRTWFPSKMMMMRSKILILVVCLAACQDFSFGLIGDKPPTFYPRKMGLECTNDDNCDDGMICYKTNKSYVGTCIKIKDK
jgi:hypothetical protein